MIDKTVKEFLDIFLESTEINPAYVIPDTHISELELDEKVLHSFKQNLENYFELPLAHDLQSFQELSCRDIVDLIKQVQYQDMKQAA